MRQKEIQDIRETAIPFLGVLGKKVQVDAVNEILQEKLNFRVNGNDMSVTEYKIDESGAETFGIDKFVPVYCYLSSKDENFKKVEKLILNYGLRGDEAILNPVYMAGVRALSSRLGTLFGGVRVFNIENSRYNRNYFVKVIAKKKGEEIEIPGILVVPISSLEDKLSNDMFV